MGCKKKDDAQQVLPAGATTNTATPFSDGGHTWNVGAVVVDGTNVPLTNIQVRAITNKESK